MVVVKASVVGVDVSCDPSLLLNIRRRIDPRPVTRRVWPIDLDTDSPPRCRPRFPEHNTSFSSSNLVGDPVLARGLFPLNGAIVKRWGLGTHVKSVLDKRNG